MSKAALRKEYLAKRKLLTTSQKNESNQAILQHILHSDLMNYETFHIFLSVEALNEIDTPPIIHELLALNKKIVLPKMHGKKLLNCAYDQQTVLEKNSWGILEPKTCVEIDAKQIDVVFTPMLICDSQGNRIGYGGGFYDRFFGTLRPDAHKIGLNYFEPIDAIPHEEYDIPVDGLITAKGLQTF